MLDEEVVQRFILDAGHHYTVDPPTYLECPICHGVLQDAVVCESGAHTFCEKCLKDWMAGSARPLCPIDREALKSGPDRPRRAPRALSEVIDALEVVCALGELHMGVLRLPYSSLPTSKD